MRVIYVDDEKLLLENFSLTAKNLPKISTINLFSTSSDALAWAGANPVDVAFLDIEMPVMNGIELAKRLKEIDENIRIVFVTAYEQYALQAFGVDAIGYLLKPYSAEDIEKELRKAYYIRQIPKKAIQIQTMPDLVVEVDGRPLKLGHTKPAELFALLVDRGEAGITKGDAIACLWQGVATCESAYWTTMSRLKSILEEAGIADIIITKGQTKSINTDMVECDLYHMLNADDDTIAEYSGDYLTRYSWAEERNAQLHQLKEKFNMRSKV